MKKNNHTFKCLLDYYLSVVKYPLEDHQLSKGADGKGFAVNNYIDGQNTEYVYVVFNPLNMSTKIGITTNVKERLAKINTQSSQGRPRTSDTAVIRPRHPARGAPNPPPKAAPRPGLHRRRRRDGEFRCTDGGTTAARETGGRHGASLGRWARPKTRFGFYGWGPLMRGLRARRWPHALPARGRRRL